MTTPSSTTTSFACDSRALAETYDRLSDTQFESGVHLVRHLGDLEGAHVLDVGCGTGRLALWIADLTGPSGSVVGLDPLPERVAIARAHACGMRFEGELRFDVGRAEDLSAFASGTFDAVCLSSVFHWVTDKAKALAEVRRVLKPGGRLGITTLSRELIAAGTLHAVVSSALERAPYADRVDPLDLAVATRAQTTTDLISTVIEGGLELAEVHVTRRSWRSASGREVVAFLESSSFGNSLRAVPEDLRDRVRMDLAAAFDARRERDGIPVTGWTTLLVATRV